MPYTIPIGFLSKQQEQQQQQQEQQPSKFLDFPLTGKITKNIKPFQVVQMVKRELGCASSSGRDEPDHATVVADPRALRSRYHTVKTILYGIYSSISYFPCCLFVALLCSDIGV